MKFARLFKITQDYNNETIEHYISIDDLVKFLQSSGEKIIRSNLKRALQGYKTINGQESVTVSSVLKYFFSHSNSSRICADVVKNIESELLNKNTSLQVTSSLQLYTQIAKINLHKYSCLFNQLIIDEENISTLVAEHKPHFTHLEWKQICWFENAFSREVNFEGDSSYEVVLGLKSAKLQNLYNLIKCSKTLTHSSDVQIRQKLLRDEISDEEQHVTLACQQKHIASVIENDIKSLIELYCPGSFECVVCFDVVHSKSTNCVRAVTFKKQHEQIIHFNDLCTRVFYMLKKKHNIYLESVSLIESEHLKTYMSENDTIYRFTLRDEIETMLLRDVSSTWNAGSLIDGTIDCQSQSECELCFRGILTKPLSVHSLNIIQEWYVELPIEAQILLENFINKDTVRKHRTPDIFLKKKLEKLYFLYDSLLNIHNKKFIGIFQKANSSRLMIEYKSVGSVFDITSAAGATSSLTQAEKQLQRNTCKDLFYFNTYLKEHNLRYTAITGDTRTLVNIRSCHLMLMLDNLVRLQYIADPNPSDHRSKQICTLPITLQGLPFDSAVTENWHLADCNGQFDCVCKKPTDLHAKDIPYVLFQPDTREQMMYSQFFNLITFGHSEMWTKMPDNLLEHIEGHQLKKEDNFGEDGSTHPILTEHETNDGQCEEQPFSESKAASIEGELMANGCNLEVETQCEDDTDLVNVLLSFDPETSIDESEDKESTDLLDESDEETIGLSALEQSLDNMSILNDVSQPKISIMELLQSFDFTKNRVPPLLTRHPPPAVGRDDDQTKIKEILDDVLLKMGYEADPKQRVNRIISGPDNKIGKCLLNLMRSSTKYQVFLPEFPLLHLRKSKITILFSSYKEAGLVQILKYMKNEEQDEWSKLVSIQHIDVATRYVKRIGLSFHLAFLIAFMKYLDQDQLHEFFSDLETSSCAETSSKWAEKFKAYLQHGSLRSGTFALHVDMMKHCDDIVAVSLAERLGGRDGYDLLLATIKYSLPYLFVNNANSYAPYCVQLLCAHHSAGYFHQCLKKELYSTPFKDSTINFALDTKREMDHIEALKGFRSGSTVHSATCRMSLIDSLNESQRQKSSSFVDSHNQETDNLGWELTETDLNHIYPTTNLILRRQALSLTEDLVPYNVYTKTPVVLPRSILDSVSDEVGQYLLLRYVAKENLFNLQSSDLSKFTNLQGSSHLVTRAKRSTGITIKRTVKSSIQTLKSERDTKEDRRQKEVSKESKLVDLFSSENNACQSLLKPDSSKPKVLKSLGMQRAIINVIKYCSDPQSHDKYINLNLYSLPKALREPMKVCTIEFAGFKFKMGHINTGSEYLNSVEKILNGMIGKSSRITKVVICEEKYSFTPDDFKASTREQRKRKSNSSDVIHLQTNQNVISLDVYNKELITKTDMGKRVVSTFLAKNVDKLNIVKHVDLIVDSELIVGKDCKCNTACECKDHSNPILFNVANSATETMDIKQRKGEAEMAVSDWLVHMQSELNDDDTAVCFVTSGDIDAVYIHLNVVSRFWKRNINGEFKNNVYVVLQKPAGKMDVYNITAILSLLEKSYKDPLIGCKLSFALCLGGNDFIPKMYAISHDTVCKSFMESNYFRNLLFTVRDGKYYIDKDIYVEFIKQIYTPKRHRNSGLSYEEIRAISIGKKEEATTKTVFRTSDPRKWLPPKPAIEKLANLIQLQMEYIQTAGEHEHHLPNFLECNCLRKNISGEIEYDFGPEAHFKCLADLPCIVSKKRHLDDTPQKGARRKRLLTSTPKAKHAPSDLS